ncbi:MAG TPA: S9 family peptidase [Sphingomicrobium sp.]|nr:S9 family peptidase [Sphingomicrobium sp.]
MRLFIISALFVAQSVNAASVPTPVTAITDPQSIDSPANPAAKPVPLGDLSAVRGAYGAIWANDGKSLVVSPNLTGRYNLWRVDRGASFPAQLTSSNEAQEPQAVTRDGMVLFLQDSGGDELYDIYSVPLAGGAASNLTSTPEIAEYALRLTPDETRIVFGRRTKTGTVIDLAIMDRATGKVRQLTNEQDASRLWSVAGFADGGRTLVANRGDITSSRSTIYRIDLENGSATAITREAPGLIITAEAVSPDGQTISVSSNEATGQLRAGLMSTQSGQTRWLKQTPWEQTAGAFSPDGKTFVVQTNADGRADISLVDVATMAERSLPFPPGFNAAATKDKLWAADGSLLVLRNGGDSPADFWAVNSATGASERLTRLAIASLDPANLPKSRIVAYPSFDGTPISAVLVMPFNLKRDGSNPAIVIPHGGPTGQTLDTFSRLATMFASRGYLVLQPNFRGSTGYGKAFQDADIKDLGGGDLEDVVAGAKFLAATGYVNPKKIGITGGSYGGFMTLMALGKRPDVFAAGVNQFGIINWFSMWENAVGGLREYQRALVGDPVADKTAYEKQSPMTYAKNIRAPLLNLQGANDVRVPKGQTDEVVQLIKANGGIVEAVYYAEEGHGFTKLENQEDARRRTIEWFDKYLKGAR